jgi:hypothetical protein
MSQHFNDKTGLILVKAGATLILDTGATGTSLIVTGSEAINTDLEELDP